MRSLLLAVLLLMPGAVSAHALSTSHLELQRDGARLQLRWDIALRDLDEAIGLDLDADGQLRWQEVREAQPRIAAHALSRLRIASDTGDCVLQFRDLAITRRAHGAYAALRIEAACAASDGALSIEYQLLFDRDPAHRGLLQFGTQRAVFSRAQPRWVTPR